MIHTIVLVQVAKAMSGSPNWTYVANTRCWIWTGLSPDLDSHNNQPRQVRRVTVTVNKEKKES